MYLLGYNAVQSGESQLTLQRKMSPPYSSRKVGQPQNLGNGERTISHSPTSVVVSSGSGDPCKGDLLEDLEIP
jgi:hypothetical protein